jgi:hypothetical protein
MRSRANRRAPAAPATDRSAFAKAGAEGPAENWPTAAAREEPNVGLLTVPRRQGPTVGGGPYPRLCPQPDGFG